MANNQVNSLAIGCAFITFDFRQGSVLNFYENISSQASDKLALKVLVSGFNNHKSNLEDYYGENITTLNEENIIAYSYLFPILALTNGSDIKEPRPNALTISFPLTEHARVYRLAPSIKKILVEIAQEIQETFIYGHKLPDKIKNRLRQVIDIQFLEQNSKVDISYISTSIPSIESNISDSGEFDDAFDIPELTAQGTNVLFGGVEMSIPSIMGGQFKSIIKEINGMKTIKEINKNLNTSLDDLIVVFNLLREKGYVSKLSEGKKNCIIFECLYNELGRSIEGLKKGKSKKMIEDALAKEDHSIYIFIRFESFERLSFQGVIQYLKSTSDSIKPSELIKLFLVPMNTIFSNLEKFFGKNMLVNVKKNLLMNLAQNYGLGDTYSIVKAEFNIID